MKFDKLGLTILTTCCLAVLAFLIITYASGYRFFVIATPSMGTTAPVGSLVVVHSQTDYQPDDIISFFRSGRIYTHRIVTVSDGQYTTKGDLNTVNDAAPAMTADIIGSSVFIGPVLGWVWRAVPMLLMGGIIVYLLSCFKRVRDDWRWPVRIIGGSIVVVIVTFIVNPWLHIEMLSYAPANRGVDMHVVNTGIFPIRLDGGGRFFSGQDTVINVTETGSDGRYLYAPRPSLGWQGVVLALIWCLMPMAMALLVRLPNEPKKITKRTRANTDDTQIVSEHRVNKYILISVVSLSIIILLVQLSSLAGLVASVKNSTNTTATRTWFTCKAAEQSMSSPAFAYAMGTAGTTETDLSANAYTGTYLVAATTTTSYGCTWDTPKASVVFNGTTQCLYLPAAAAITNPNVFTLEAWFNTTAMSNGKIIGLGSSRNTVADGTYDRQIYIDAAGRVVFGVYPGAVRIAASAPGVNYADGAWHHVVATMSSAGMKLYLDGALVGQNAATTNGQSYLGYWKVGCGKLGGWSNGDGTAYTGPAYFKGNIQYAAVSYTALTATQVTEHYLAGKP